MAAPPAARTLPREFGATWRPARARWWARESFLPRRCRDAPLRASAHSPCLVVPRGTGPAAPCYAPQGTNFETHPRRNRLATIRDGFARDGGGMPARAGRARGGRE